MSSSSPFLRLPREIRDFISRKLLSTEYTFTEAFTAEFCRWPYKFTPAILRLNRQITQEASEVMYTENQFVLLSIATQRFTRCLRNFPNFDGLSESRIDHPALKVSIRDLEMLPLHQQTTRTFIFTLEGFPYFIKQLLLGENCKFYNTMSFAISVYNRTASRQGYLDSVVRSLDQIPGFAEFRIRGDIDNEIAQHLTERMAQGPHLHEVVSKIIEISSQSERYLKQKEYGPAKWFCERQSMYWGFHRLLSQEIPPRTRYLQRDFLEATMPLMMKLKLRKQMINLYCKRYQHVADHAYKPLIVSDKLITKYTLSYCVPPVLSAKFMFCEFIGEFVQGESKRAAETLACTALALQDDERFTANYCFDLCNQLEWAMDSFLEQQGDLQNRDKKEHRRLMLDAGAALYGWRSFGDWMELPERSFG